MTDLEQLKAMLERAHIEFNISPYADGIVIVVDGGYVGFWTQFAFDTSGALLSIGAYE